MSKHEHARTNAANQIVAPRWLTLATASTYSGLTGQTLRNWAKAGKLTLHNVTPTGTRGRVLIDRIQLDALIESYAGAPSSTLEMNKKWNN